MNKQKNFVQRRQHLRFRVDNAMVGIARQRYTRLGQIVDISLGGMAFRYVDNGPNDPGFPEEAECFLSLSLENFQLEDLPYRTVHDFQLLPAYLELRQRCLQFNTLTPAQLVQLEYVISYLTGGPIIDSRRRTDRRYFSDAAQNDSRYDDSAPAPSLFDRRSGQERRACYH